MKTFYFVISYLVFLFSFSATFSQDFEVAPVKLNYDCEPGQTQTRVVTIKNHSNQKHQFTLVVSDLSIDSLGNKIKSKGSDRSLKEWITINPAFFNLNPNETGEIKVVMQVPPGHYETRWGMIYVAGTEEQTAMEADKAMHTGIKVKPRIGIRVVQSPKSNKNYKGTISQLQEITQAQDSVRTFQVKISNTGDKLMEAKIHLILSNLETASEIKAKPTKLTLLPGSVRYVKLSFPQNVPPGKYSMAAILDYGHHTTLEAVEMNVEVK